MMTVIPETSFYYCITGADPVYKVRGGALKIIAPSGVMRENFGVFRVKNHDFTQQNHIFSNFRGSARRVRPPPGSAPVLLHHVLHK